MIYEFGGFELDTSTVELRLNGAALALQPQVFNLLFLLVENHDRMVSRDEIVEKVWHGRAISETAISSRIKTLRQVLGDDGTEQRLIRTLHGRGFRCIAEVALKMPAVVGSVALEPAGSADRAGPPAIAVLPFRSQGPRVTSSLGDALAHDIIVSLSRLRWLRVIARGSAFRFRDADPDLAAVGQALGVRYCLTGDIEQLPRGADVAVELADTRDATIVWSERFRIGPEEISALRDVICRHVVAGLEHFIPENEALIARSLPRQQLNSWSNFHLGLHHMYRLNREDNARAAGHFRDALALEPEFARAWAGLSFTSFQSAYLGYLPEVAEAARAARRQSERALSIDGNDAFSHFTMGRSYWLEGRVADSLPWIQGATELSPSYAQGHYSQAWAAAMLGRPEPARASVDVAMALSPLDPFLYAMKGTKALSYLAEGAPGKAIPWIEEAAGTPGAHPVVGLVAAACHALDGDAAAARTWIARIRRETPGVSREYFFRSIPFADPALRRTISRALGAAGLP